MGLISKSNITTFEHLQETNANLHCNDTESEWIGYEKIYE